MIKTSRLALDRQAWAARWAQFDMEVLAGYMLQIGILVSMTLIALGMVWRWLNTGVLGLDYTLAGMSFFEFVLSDLQQVLAPAGQYA